MDTNTGKDEIARILVRRYQNPAFETARYLFLTKHAPGQKDLELFRALMHKVKAQCDLITVENGAHGMSSWKAPEMQHWKPEMIAWLEKMLRMKP